MLSWFLWKNLLLKLGKLRMKKKINNIKTACQIADQCLEEIVKIIKTSVTEKEIAFKIEFG